MRNSRRFCTNCRSPITQGIYLFLAIAVAAPIAAQSQSPTPTARDLFRQGQSAETSENYYRAIELYIESLNLNPSYLPPMLGLADAYYAINEFDAALKYVQQAQKYAGDSSSVENLHARILLGLGQIDAARKLYQTVLAGEPYNIEARIGLAELSVAQGNTDGALAEYQEAVRLEPQNRKALLSLALIYRSRGQYDIEGKYIKLALQYHSDSALVHLLAGEYFLSVGETNQALTQAQTAIALQPDYPSALILLGTIYLHSGDYAKSAATMDQLISQYGNRPDSPGRGTNGELPLAWYLKAIAQDKLGRPADAIQSFQRELALDPSDEVARLAMEAVVKASLPLESPKRDAFAAYHFKLANDLVSQNLFQHALFQYRQGLQIAPYSLKGRIAFADIYRFEGFRAKYVNELDVLRNIGYKDKSITDNLEIYRSLLEGSVASDWNINQFQLSRTETSVLVYQIPSRNVLSHPDSGTYFASYLRDLLLGYELVQSPKPAQTVQSFSDAFASARASGSDYFVILSIDESNRTVKLTGTLYLSRTGAETASFTVYRAGNDRIRQATAQLADEIHALFPISGTLIARNFGTGVIDLGQMHGVNVGDVLTIVQSGQLSRSSDGSAIVYPAQAVEGTFTVTRVDDAVAEGTLKQQGYTDLMNVGDSVIYPPKQKPQQPAASVLFPPLFQRLRNLR
ncbi:MAG TPA: tetratricopeptide repeat protein [Spirochaetia bacterium]|nr:tetratricopeptide repeat protein [Spirochaetia bacterium]